jgi:hypothetical protein
MFRGKARLRATALLIAALTALLVFAAAAAAETRTGESSTPQSGVGLTPEASLVKASASYETASGSVGFSVTTAAEPGAESKLAGRPSEATLKVSLFQSTAGCDFTAIESRSVIYPEFEVESRYAEREASHASLFQSEIEAEELGAAVPSVSGTTTTVSFASGRLANQGWNCALVLVGQGHEGAFGFLIFPITAAVIPPAAPATPAPTAAPASGPARARPVLSIAKAKPLKLKIGKSRTVKVKVTNTGATATAQGSLRVKPTKGVLVTPETQKLPALAPGASWTVSVRVKLTAKAKKKSTLSLTGAASGVTGKGSLVVKRTE